MNDYRILFINESSFQQDNLMNMGWVMGKQRNRKIKAMPFKEFRMIGFCNQDKIPYLQFFKGSLNRSIFKDYLSECISDLKNKNDFRNQS